MRGATILKASDDKTRELNKGTLMAFSGEAGDTGSIHSSLLIGISLLIEPIQFSSQNIYKQTYNYIQCAMIQTWDLQPWQTSYEENSLKV